MSAAISNDSRVMAVTQPVQPLPAPAQPRVMNVQEKTPDLPPANDHIGRNLNVQA